MPLKIFRVNAKSWVGGNLFHNKWHHKSTWLSYLPDEHTHIQKVIYKNVFLTSCCQLWTFANTFVVVCILCTEITSWLPDAAYFACCSTEAFKVYPVGWKRKNEGRGGGSLWLLFLKRQRPTHLYSSGRGVTSAGSIIRIKVCAICITVLSSLWFSRAAWWFHMLSCYFNFFAKLRICVVQFLCRSYLELLSQLTGDWS